MKDSLPTVQSLETENSFQMAATIPLYAHRSKSTVLFQPSPSKKLRPCFEHMVRPEQFGQVGAIVVAFPNIEQIFDSAYNSESREET